MKHLQVVGASILGVVIAAVALGATYNQFSPGGALSGTWNSQNVNVGAGAPYIAGTLPVSNGGTGVTTAGDDTTLVGNGSAWVPASLPDCADSDGQHLNYSRSSNSFSCGSSAVVTETTGTFTATFDTGFTVPQTQTFVWTKVGSIVVLRSTTQMTGTSNATSVVTSGTPVPAALRPVALTSFNSVPGTNNGSAAPACIRILVGGGLQYGLTDAGNVCQPLAWSTTGAKAIYGSTFTYSVAN
jgi:hypothetical protein